jgi:hypothetical protein
VKLLRADLKGIAEERKPRRPRQVGKRARSRRTHGSIFAPAMSDSKRGVRFSHDHAVGGSIAAFARGVRRDVRSDLRKLKRVSSKAEQSLPAC